MIEMILVLIGVFLGCFLGLLPGSHINNLLPFLLTFSSFLTPVQLSLFIISIAISQLFSSFIPSIFLGAPESETALSVLPGHRLLLEGKGYEAIKLVIIGALGSLILTLLLIFVLTSFFQEIYQISRPYIHYLILLVIGFMVLSEKNPKRIFWSILIILLSGFFGIIVLNSSLVPQHVVLFPTLSGMFGVSTILISMEERSQIPKQKKDQRIRISFRDIFISIILGSVAGIVVGFLPAIGVSQAATMVQYLGRMGESRSFLVTLSGINLGNEVFSLVSLYLVRNPRSGASVAIQRIMGELTLNDVILFIGAICLSAGISSILTLFLGKKIPKYLCKIDYKLLCYLTILYLICMVFIFTGIFGLLILFTSTSLGILAAKTGIRRSNCMGVLLIPSLLFFSKLNPLVFSMLGI